MFPIIDFKDKCWWCGNQADSQEHKYKKSDLIRELGKVSNTGSKGYGTKFIGNKEMKDFQGPNSQEVKFSKNICQYCNNTRSQPFDRAYDIFVGYIKENEFSIMGDKQLSFSKIFGQDWKNKRDNLFRYYVKHICCWLATYNIWIAPEIIVYLNGSSYLKYILLNFDICFTPVVIMRAFNIIDTKAGHFAIDPMSCRYSIDKNNAIIGINEIRSAISYRSLRCSYIYDSRILTNQSDIDIVPLKITSNLNANEFLDAINYAMTSSKKTK